MTHLLALETELGQIGGENLGPFAKTPFTTGGSALAALTQVISSIIGIMTISAGIWFIFQFLTGGFFWITSGGDKEKLHDARERITNAFIGLLIVVGGFAILALAGQFLGFENILIKNPDNVIKLLGG